MIELNNSNIHSAVKLWNKYKQEAINIYGLIQDWNVSKVTNMKELFKNIKIFNDDINNWNVSNVKDMSGMFFHATSFDKNNMFCFNTSIKNNFVF